MSIKLEITLLIGLRKDKETGIWISYNPDLDLYSQGSTEEEALESLKLGISTHLMLCHERGILFNVIKDLIKKENLSPVKDFIDPERLRKKSEQIFKQSFGKYRTGNFTTLQFATI